MDNCIFCKINSGEIPKNEIYSDEKVSAIYDINPESKGHTIIITKTHIGDVMDMSDELSCHINKVTQKLIRQLEEEYNCDGFKITTNYGISQEIKHYHLHLVPVYK